MTADPSKSQETKTEARFAFGSNWNQFLRVLDDERIAAAEQSLRDMLGVTSLEGKTFLDIGCGSGLFSLAAMRLGAARVHSVDYDRMSVACAQQLHERYFRNAENWTIAQGSVLDVDGMARLGKWDVVYSWGVLHHTGAMWTALKNAGELVKDGGTLFISIYNDQGWLSRFWTAVKRIYNSNAIGKGLVLATFVPYFTLRWLLADIVRFRNPLRRYFTNRSRRGMAVWYDMVDWLGGYPFEVATPEQIFNFYSQRGFTLKRITTTSSVGCNEFVFARL